MSGAYFVTDGATLFTLVIFPSCSLVPGRMTYRGGEGLVKRQILTVCTVGYEGASISALIQLLLENGILESKLLGSLVMTVSFNRRRE